MEWTQILLRPAWWSYQLHNRKLFHFKNTKRVALSHPFCCEEAGSDKRDLDLVALTAPLSVILHDAPPRWLKNGFVRSNLLSRRNWDKGKVSTLRERVAFVAFHTGFTIFSHVWGGRFCCGCFYRRFRWDWRYSLLRFFQGLGGLSFIDGADIDSRKTLEFTSLL